MFRAILGADFHLRDDTPEDLGYGIQLLDDTGTLAQKNGVSTAIIAGDFFHYKHRFSQELLVAVYSCLEKWHNAGVTFVIVLGNHDQPDPNQAGWSILRIFSRVATIVTHPMLVEEDDCTILLMPWYEPETYKRMLKEFTRHALGSTKPRILISHVSLQEGHVSPSNTRVSTPIRLHHLFPDVWETIWLGDYHAHQKVSGGKAIYCGAPRPTTFGDYDTVGVWLVDCRGGVPVALPSRYPAFLSHRVDSIADLPLREYDTRDKHRIYCRLELRSHVSTLYPTAKIENIEVAPEKDTGRLAELDKQNSMEVVDKWMKIKKLDPKVYRPEVKRFL